MSDNTRDDQANEGSSFDPTAETPYPEAYGEGEAFPPPPPPPPSPWRTPSGDETQEVDAGSTQELPEATTPPPPLADNPYATPTPSDFPPPPSGPSPYGATGGPSPYGQQPPYGAPGSPYGAPPPAYYQTQAAQSNTSALILTILSGLGVFVCCGVTIISLILGIVALTKQSSEPEQSAKLTKWGWVVFGISAGLAVLAVIGFIAFYAVSPTTTY